MSIIHYSPWDMPAPREWWVGTYQTSEHQIIVGTHGLGLQPFTHSEPSAERYPTQRKHGNGDMQELDAIAGRIDHDGGLGDVTWRGVHPDLEDQASG